MSMATTEPRTDFKSMLREAIVGTTRDFTEDSIGRAIFILSVPAVLEMCMESLFGIVNVFWVSRLGAPAVAAVGITESLLTIIFAIALGLSMATTAVVARRTGEKDSQGASTAAVQGIILGILASIPIGLIGILFAPALLRFMGAEPEVISTGGGYARIILGGNAAVMLLFLINAVFRGAGDAAIAMRALWLGNIVNLLLDPCLIFGLGPFPELGVTGSAVATTIGRGLGVVYQVSVLFSTKSRISVRMRDIRFEPAIARSMLKISFGGMLQYLVATASWAALVRLVAAFGSAALAGYTIALRLIVVALLPSWGMSNAAATLVGQNLGANKPDRAEKSVWITGVANMFVLGAVAVFFILFAEGLIGVFTSDADVIANGVACLRIVSYGYVFYAYGMVMVQSFNGAGDTFTPTLINLGCYWLFQIPLSAYLALRTSLGSHGVFLAITISESALALVAMLAFRRGRWKKQKV